VRSDALPARLAARLPGWSWRIAVLGVLAGLLVPQVFTKDRYLFIACTVCVYVLAAIGMNILHGYTGQVSLGQGALLAIGAYVTGVLTVDHGWNLWASMVPAILVSLAVAVVFALPALRLSRWVLGMITLVLSGLVQELILQAQGLTHGGAGIVGIPQFSFLPDQLLDLGQVYYVLFFLILVGLWLTWNLHRSPMGRAMMAVRDSEIAAQAASASVPRIKLFAFVASAVTAGLAGSFWAGLNGVITPDQFDLSLSIFILLTILVGGDGRLEAPVLGAILLFAVPQLMTGLAQYRLIIYGILLLVIAIFAPFGLSGLIRMLAARFTPRRVPVIEEGVGESAELAPVVRERREGVGVKVENLDKRFGGLQALDSIELEVPAGVIHGIIGPNGSGKTTLLNLISGFYPLDRGRVLIGDRDVSRWGASRIAALGVARTFQQPKMLEAETVLENVMLGAYRLRRATLGEWMLRIGRARREDRRLQEEAMAWLRFLGLAHIAHVPCELIPHGQRRLVEIARALAAHPTLLLLDEPAAGLPPDEIDRLAEVVVAVRDLGITVLLVEHHIDLIVKLASGLTVMHMGRVLAHGPADDVMKMPAVLTAYIGVEDGDLSGEAVEKAVQAAEEAAQA
jgi:ABC-type branched-subunit amino acid transport system ATPase component/ABC-type branched-subunit amino acid transport system permease subunit